MSTSFPYLTLSRRLSVPYREILEIVDDLDAMANAMESPVSWGACSGVIHHHVREMWMAEQERRRRVLSES